MILLQEKRIQDFTQWLFTTTQDSKTRWSNTLLRIPSYRHRMNLLLLFTPLYLILKEFTLWLITTLYYITQYILISKESTLQLNTCDSTHLSLHHCLLLSMPTLLFFWVVHVILTAVCLWIFELFESSWFPSVTPTLGLPVAVAEK